jgi:hypothetical protein
MTEVAGGMVTPGSPVRDLWPPERERGRMGTMAVTCLRRARIGTVGELTAITALEVADIRGSGAATVAEVRRALARRGLSLRDDDGTTGAEVDARVGVLVRAGLRRGVALRFARESWPAGEIAPGLVLTVAALAGDRQGPRT